MSWFKKFLLFLISVFVFCKSHEIPIIVFYESLCPDSIFAFRRELQDVKEYLGEYLEFRFNPFGKANISEEFAPEEWIECQHGVNECKINKLLACATKYRDCPMQEVDFVFCMMGTGKGLAMLDQCSLDTNYNKTLLLECAEREGIDLLRTYAEQMRRFKPSVTWLPTVAVGKVIFFIVFVQFLISHARSR